MLGSSHRNSCRNEIINKKQPKRSLIMMLMWPPSSTQQLSKSSWQIKPRSPRNSRTSKVTPKVSFMRTCTMISSGGARSGGRSYTARDANTSTRQLLEAVQGYFDAGK